MNNILLLEDLTCSGECSSLISLPVLFNLNLNPIFVPTMILSTHTGGNNMPYKFDMVDKSCEIIKNLSVNNKEINGVFMGYLSPNIDENFINTISNLNAKIYLDPVMADNSKFYKGFDESYINKILPLIKRSEVITPNLTEACFLLNKEYKDFSINEVEDMLYELAKFNSKYVVITGVKKDNLIGVMAIDCSSNLIYFYFHEYVNASYFGTGDLFKSVLFSKMFLGNSLLDSIKSACDIIVDCIKESNNPPHLNYINRIKKV